MPKSAKGSHKPEEPTQIVPRQYTQGEKARIAKYVDRLRHKSVKFQKPKSRSKRKHLECVNSQEAFTKVQLAEALGSADPDFQVHAIDQIVATFPGVLVRDCTDSLARDHDRMVTAVNVAMAILTSIQPRNEVETLLVVQMIAVHNMAMESLRSAMVADLNVQLRETHMKASAKMLGIFTAQAETLRRSRGGGQQKMVVEHVHVNEGGKAIVGNVQSGSAGN